MTLTGSGGVGKTRLALQVASEIHDAFSDGVYLVELAPIGDPALVLPTIAQPRHPRRREQAPRDVLADFLREKRLLLLLDNFEQILPAASDIAELLRGCPHLTVLVTSRRAPPARRARVSRCRRSACPSPAAARSPPSLPRILPSRCSPSERWRRARSFTLDDDNAATAAEICRRLDGLPLAIELAAARVKLLAPRDAQPPGAPAAAADGRSPRPPRASAHPLRDTIAWSYDLNDEEQRLVRRLAVFVGGCTLDCRGSLRRGCRPRPGPRRWSVRRRRLAGRQEPAAAGGWSGTASPLRDAGDDPGVCSGAVARFRRGANDPPPYLAWACDLAERGQEGIHGPDGVAWIDRLAADHDNFRAALTWSLADHDRTSARTW